MPPDEVYKIFAKFVVANPTASFMDVVHHVWGYDNTTNLDTLKGWYDHWRVLWQELAL